LTAVLWYTQRNDHPKEIFLTILFYQMFRIETVYHSAYEMTVLYNVL